jgi:hypothetical protein
VWIPFESTQIKSVYNRGTFDAGKPNIYFQERLSAEAEAKLKSDEESFVMTLKEIKLGKIKSSEMIDVMTTPLVFLLAGADVLPVKMVAGKIEEVKQKHNLSDAEIVKIPRLMADPIAIFESSASSKGNKGLVVMTEMKDEKGATVVVPIHLNRINLGYQVNVLASIYKKNNQNTQQPDNDWFIREIENGRLLYWDTKKGSEWTNLTGLRLPPAANTQSLIANNIPTEADLPSFAVKSHIKIMRKLALQGRRGEFFVKFYDIK